MIYIYQVSFTWIELLRWYGIFVISVVYCYYILSLDRDVWAIQQLLHLFHNHCLHVGMFIHCQQKISFNDYRNTCNIYLKCLSEQTKKFCFCILRIVIFTSSKVQNKRNFNQNPFKNSIKKIHQKSAFF